MRYCLVGILIILCSFVKGSKPTFSLNQEGLRVSTFDIDVTPPVGSFLAYCSATNVWDLGLRARGIVLLGASQPIVLCSIDWIGIGNEGHDAFCLELAKAERKDLFVAVAGYGDYGPGYIGTTIAYKQGGYETGYVSNVSPETENVLMAAMRKLLHHNP